MQGFSRAVLAGLALSADVIAASKDARAAGITASSVVLGGINRLAGHPPFTMPGRSLGARDAGDTGLPARKDVNRLFSHVREVMQNSLVQIQHQTLDLPFVEAAESVLEKAALNKWGRDRFRLAIEALADRYGATTFQGSIADTWYSTIILNASYNRAAVSAYATEPTIRLFPYLAFRDAGDDVVRPSHHALDGFVAASDWGGWTALTPPLDWNCRCRVVPVAALISKTLGWEGEFPRGREFLMPREVDGETVMPGPNPDFRSPLLALEGFLSGAVSRVAGG